MKKQIFFPAFLVAIFLWSGNIQAQVEDVANPLLKYVNRNNGLRFTAGGRLFTDVAYYHSEYTPMKSGAAITDARIRTSLKYKQFYFYADFDLERAQQMLADLHLSPNTRLKTMSKGTKEKVQLILVMSRRAQLYLLDEPIGGVDPAAREYILNTILKNFDESSSILITTHLIQDVEAIFDQVLFLNQGKIVIDGEVDEIRQQHGKSIDRLFREVFKC